MNSTWGKRHSHRQNSTPFLGWKKDVLHRLWCMLGGMRVRTVRRMMAWRISVFSFAVSGGVHSLADRVDRILTAPSLTLAVSSRRWRSLARRPSVKAPSLTNSVFLRLPVQPVSDLCRLFVVGERKSGGGRERRRRGGGGSTEEEEEEGEGEEWEGARVEGTHFEHSREQVTTLQAGQRYLAPSALSQTPQQDALLLIIGRRRS